MSSPDHVIGWYAIVYLLVVGVAVALFANPNELSNVVREESVRQCIIQARHLTPGGGDLQYTPVGFALTAEEAERKCKSE